MKKILSLFLVLLMLFTSVPVAFAAKDNTTLTNESEYSVEGTNSIGKMLSSTLSAGEGEGSGTGNNSYYISEVVIEGDTATVSYVNASDCYLVIAAYDEDSMEMLCSDSKNIEANSNETEMKLDNLSAEYMVIKAFMLDENYHPLSGAYTYSYFTKAYKEIESYTVSDFDPDKVVNLDESNDTNFMVLNDDVKTVAKGENENTLVSADFDNDIYTFANANDSLKAIKKGDIFSYSSDNFDEFILIEVTDITIGDDGTVVITGKQLNIEEAFEVVKIDSTVQSEGYNDSGIATCGMDPIEKDYSFKPVVFNLDYPKEEDKKDDSDDNDDDSVISGQLHGDLTINIEVHVKVYLSNDFKEVEFKITPQAEVNFSAEVALNGVIFKLPGVSIKPIPCLNIGLKPRFKISVSGKVSVQGTLGFQVGFNWNNNEFRNLSEGLKPDWDGLNVEATVFLGFDLHPTVSVINDEVVEASCDGTAGFELSGKTVYIKKDDRVIHDCKHCIDGNIDFKIDVSFELVFAKEQHGWFIKEKKFTFPILGATIHIIDFYYSISHDEFDFGECPHKLVRVDFLVTDSGTKKAIEGAKIESGAKDKISVAYNKSSSVTTNEDGKASYYYPLGKFTGKVTADNYNESTTQKINVTYVKDVDKYFVNKSEEQQTIKVKMTKNSSTGGSTSNPTDLDLSQSYVYFGSYPQSKVTDEATISALNAKAPSWDSWTSYGYYSGTMTQGDWMRYTDVTYGGEKYRGVKFTQYRPYYTYSSSSNNTYQDDNGYSTNTIYWFKFESLKWRVLDASTGLIMCETIIDSQPYSNTIYHNSSISDSRYGFFNDSSYTNYASDYETSSIRDWLNDDFYNTAFTSADQSIIATSTLNNDGYYILTGTTGYEKLDSNDTNDKIFLLSYDEAINSKYGFSTDRTDYDTARRAKGSDYAKCQGLWVSTSDSYKENSNWLLRSPGYSSNGCCKVISAGYVDYYYYVYYSSNGVRPALKLNLSSVISQSNNLKSNNPAIASYAAPVALSTTPTVFSTRSATATKSATKSDTLKGSDYVLLVVKDPNSEDMLSSDNLLYIDQKTAESDTISFDYILPTGTSTYTATIYGVSHTGADHTYSDWSTTKAPTCTESGTAQRTCTACDQIETKTLDPTGHTFSGSLCTTCGYDRANECTCNCHKSGITHFFFVIVNFFQKLFGNNKVCACGAIH